MTYEAGIGASLAAAMGREPHGPRVRCDGCGVVREAKPTRRYVVPLWLMQGRAPPGWRMERVGDLGRKDTCPACRRKALREEEP